MASPNRWDIDKYLNPFIPRSPIHLLPRPIAHFLGHRPPNSTKYQAHTLFVWAWCFVGAFAGVALIEGVYLHLPTLDDRHVPIIIASFGAAAILEYNTIESPLAQPRNLILGHLLAALTGISITKLFHLLPTSEFEKLRWLAGALSVGAASVIMSMTKTVHPPAGATALIAATDSMVTDLGWWLLALILLGCMLMLVSALLINNIMRQFPIYWWTPVDLAALHKQRKAGDGEVADTEKAIHRKASQNEKSETRTSDEQVLNRVPESDTATEVDLQSANEGVNDTSRPRFDSAVTQIQSTEQRDPRVLSTDVAHQKEIVIAGDELILPEGFEANDWEVNVLQILQQRLVEMVGDGERRKNDTK